VFCEIFSKKGLDKHPFVCYNKGTKGKEIIKMTAMHYLIAAQLVVAIIIFARAFKK
jgi:hypothetical protein